MFFKRLQALRHKLPLLTFQVISRRLGLNLSQLTQRAIQDFLEENADEVLDVRVAAASERIAALEIKWPDKSLAQQREEAGER